MMKVTTFYDDFGTNFGTDLHILMMKTTSFDDKNNYFDRHLYNILILFIIIL
jgi:hypothetical protein